MSTESSERRAERLKLYDDYKTSCKSVKEYALERGMSQWILRERIKKTEREQNEATGFRELSVGSSSMSGEYVVVLQSGRSLKVPAMFNEHRVAQLIGILERC